MGYAPGMVAAGSIGRSGSSAVSEEQRLVISNVSWKDYLVLGDVLGDHPAIRLTYLEGTLEIMSPSSKHEGLKKVIARLLELHALLRGVRILGYGSTTYHREEKERGLEPDECYFVGAKKEFPDLAIEVVVSSSGVNKLKVYEGLGVREVWVFEETRFRIHELTSAGYAERQRSALFPDLDFDRLAAHVAMPDQDDAVRSYWEFLQGASSQR